MSPPSIWQTLGIDPTRDPQQIRRAYARRLKSTNPEDDAEGFKTLRAAYEQALAHVGRAGPIASASAGADTAAKEASETERPPAPPISDAKGRHIAACRRLAALVGASEPPDPVALDQALEAVLSSPALDEIGVRVDTDLWLAQLIAHNRPRSDPLLDKTIAHFGWSDRAIGRKDADVIRWLLQRQSDRAFLRQAESPGNMHRWASAALQRAPARPGILERLRGRDRTAAVATLLAEIRTRHPTIVADLDPTIVAAWDGYLSKPRLSPRELWAVVIASVVAVLIATVQVVEPPGPENHTGFFLVPLVVLAPLAGGALIRLYGVAWPRWCWLRRPPARRPGWLAMGWAPSALALLIVAALVPASIPAVFAVGVLATAVVFWVLITGLPETRDGGMLPAGRLVLREALLVAWWIVIRHELPVARYVAISLALAAAIVVGIVGARPLVDLWFMRLGPRDRTFGLLALLASAAGAGLLLWLAAGNPLLAAPAAATIAVVSLLSRPASMGMGPRAARLVNYAMRALGILFILALMSGIPFKLPIGGAWLMVVVALTAGALLAAQVGHRRTRERA